MGNDLEYHTKCSALDKSRSLIPHFTDEVSKIDKKIVPLGKSDEHRHDESAIFVEQVVET